MAEGFFRRRAEDAGIPASVASCGLLEGGRPVPQQVLSVMLSRDIDLGGHLSQPLTPVLVEESHLVLGMERQHVREAVVLVPGSLARCFTLRDFVWRAQQVGNRGSEPLPSWLARLGEDRTTRDLLGSDSLDEVPDPMGQAYSAFEATADELDELVAQAFSFLFDAPMHESDEPIDLERFTLPPSQPLRQPRGRLGHPLVPDPPSFGLGPDDLDEPFAMEDPL
jgi:protein-tyrosine-phosphatase